jgi:hypothetical protein
MATSSRLRPSHTSIPGACIRVRLALHVRLPAHLASTGSHHAVHTAHHAPPIAIQLPIHRLALIYVAGNNVFSLNPVGKSLVAFKLVALKRGVMDYHNNFFIARELSWVYARQLAGAPSRGRERVRVLPTEKGEVS